MESYWRGARERSMIAAGTDPDAARDEAFILKMENDLCLHEDDERTYRSEAEYEADERPAVVCNECDKKRLIVSIMVNGPVGEAARALIIKNYLR